MSLKLLNLFEELNLRVLLVENLFDLLQTLVLFGVLLAISIAIFSRINDIGFKMAETNLDLACISDHLSNRKLTTKVVVTFRD